MILPCPYAEPWYDIGENELVKRDPVTAVLVDADENNTIFAFDFSSDVKSSRSKWPRGQNFGLGLASIALSYYVIGHFSCKNRVKFGDFVNFSGNNLKSYVVNHYLVLFYIYFWPRPRPRPRSSGSASASRFWPRLTSLDFSSCYLNLRLHKITPLVTFDEISLSYKFELAVTSDLE